MQKKKEFIRKIIKKCGKTINHYELIKANETVAVALSGGKDSLSLLDILHTRLKHLPVSYNLISVHVHVKGITNSIDTEKLQDFALKRSSAFYLEEIDIDLSSDKDPCFICSWHRRKKLFSLCQRLGIKKLALGHTLNDIAETLLMNMFFQGNISTMPVSLPLFDGDLTIIRPLGETEETDISEYASTNNLPIQESRCPYSKEQTREEMRELLDRLSKKHPQVRQTLVKSMKNIHDDYIF